MGKRAVIAFVVALAALLAYGVVRAHRVPDPDPPECMPANCDTTFDGVRY